MARFIIQMNPGMSPNSTVLTMLDGTHTHTQRGKKKKKEKRRYFWIWISFMCMSVHMHIHAFYLEKYCFAIQPPEVSDRIATVPSARNELKGCIAVWTGFLCKNRSRNFWKTLVQGEGAIREWMEHKSNRTSPSLKFRLRYDIPVNGTQSNEQNWIVQTRAARVI